MQCQTQNDIRRYIALSTFGFFQKGILDVKLTNFQIEDNVAGEVSRRIFVGDLIDWLYLMKLQFNQFGLTLDKTMSDAMNPFIDDHQDKCILQESISKQHHGPIAYLTMDFKNQM